MTRKRFRRRYVREAATPDLTNEGDWITFPAPHLCQHFTDAFMERPSSVDLLLALDA